jgi:flagellar biosynthesis protein FlhF
MKIKKFTAVTYKEAVQLMKDELGSDAIILSSKKIKSGGVLDVFGKDLIELTAAIDHDTNRTVALKNVEKKFNQNKNTVNSRLKDYLNQTEKNNETQPAKNADSSIVITNQLKRTTDAINKESVKVSELQSEVSSMKSLLGQLSEELRNQKLPALPQYLKASLKQMISQEVNEDLAKNLINILYANLTINEIENKKIVDSKLMKMIENLIKTGKTFQNTSKNKPYVIALVGPTGVGKTTTIAKIAANSKLYDQLKVGIVTTDTYRIAAADQLGTFASIANIPFEVAYSKEDLEKCIAQFSDKDMIFIDTVGRSQNNDNQLNDLAKILKHPSISEIHLVLSATTSYKTMIDIINKYSLLGVNRLIFTKLDEVDSYGNILNIEYEKKLALSYLTTGQTVPDDIDTVHSDRLANLIYHGMKEQVFDDVRA